MNKVLNKDLFWAIALGVTGYYVNSYSYELAYGVSFSFGGIFIALCILLFSPIHGAIAAFISSCSTYALYHHPYAIIIWTLEALVTGVLFRRTKNKSLLMSDSIYWLAIGFPIIFFFYQYILKNSFSDALLIAVKQSLNGIVNVLIAEISYFAYINFFPFNNSTKNKKIKTSEVIFHMTIGFLIIPTLLFTIYISKVELNQSEMSIANKMNDKYYQMDLLLEDWLEDQKIGISQLVKLSSFYPQKPTSKLQSELKTIKEIFPYYHNLYLADKTATAYAFYPQYNSANENLIGLSFSDQNYFKTVQNSKNVTVSEIFMGRFVNEPMFTISAPILDDKKEFKGFALGAVNIKKLTQKMDEITKDSGISYTIIDQNNVIFSTNYSERKVMTKFEIKSNKISEINGTNLKVRTPPQEKQSALIADWKRSYYYSKNSLGFVPWKIILEAPVKNIQMMTFTKLRFILTMSLCFIYMAIFFSLYLSKKFAFTIRKVAEIAHNSTATAKQVEWPESKLEEISMLLESLKGYKNKIDNHIEVVYELNKSLEEKVLIRTQELSESEKRYRTFFEENFAPMLMVDCQTRMVFDANQAAIVFYGWNIEEMRSKHIDEINCTPNIDQTVVGHLSDVRHRRKQVFQFLHRTANKGIRDVEVYATKIDVGNKEIIFSIIHDVTERISAEKLVEEQRAKLVVAERMAHLGEMAGGISHAVNNPLAVIAGKAKQVKRYAEYPIENKEQILKSMDLILTMTQRIARIESSLKDFARNAEDGHLEVVSMRYLIENALILCRHVIESKEINIKINELSSDLKTECNPSMISKALSNLINNSCDAIENLEEKWIKISVQKSDKNILITVTDSGTGIDKKIVEKMMVPFFTTKEVGKGAGLGLSMSLGIIENHKGSIEYNSFAHNTEFVVTLPTTSKKAA